jgi:ribosome-associated protein
MNARKPKKAAAKKSTTSRKAAPKAVAAKKPRQARRSAAPSAPATQTPTPVHPRLLSLIVKALDAKKTEAIHVLNVGALSSITDYMVLGTATSDPHLRALRVELEKVIDAEGAKILGMDTTKGSGWLVVDAFDVMVHLFTPENRDRYRLDLLWRDAQEVPVNRLL